MSHCAVESRGYKTPCWIWKKACTRGGYGVIWSDGKVRYAHRLAYEALHGAIPDELQIDHLCRQRACLNPAHLEVVTVAENTRRGRNTKLTPAAVESIRASSLRTCDLARMFGVAPCTISNVRGGRGWETTP